VIDRDSRVEREWFAAAIELEAENRHLRAVLTSLLFWVAGREKLLELARASIERRWKDDP